MYKHTIHPYFIDMHCVSESGLMVYSLLVQRHDPGVHLMRTSPDVMWEYLFTGVSCHGLC